MNLDTVFDLDIWSSPLSLSAKRQLSPILNAFRSGKNRQDRCQLADHIVANAYDPQRGIYIPVSDRVKSDKSPVQSQQVSPDTPPSTFFTNALVIPEGYGCDGFDISNAAKPIKRATNSGTVIVTIEFDCETIDQFEETLAWTRATDGKGKFSSTKFTELDRQLSNLQEYRGYCIVFSGRRSLHFHFKFATDHLENAPSTASAQERLKQHHTAELMSNVHALLWDHVADAFNRILKPSLEPDRKLRGITQWRRGPWGKRVLEKPSMVLGLDIGAVVPQVVIHENIRQRAPKKHDGFLVSPTYSLCHPVRSIHTRKKNTAFIETDDDLLKFIQMECEIEWDGEYPKPVWIGLERGEWLIRFKNHAYDVNPSTIVKGEHHGLLIYPERALDGDFFLPHDLTCDKFVEHAAIRLGRIQVPVTANNLEPVNTTPKRSGPPSFDDLRTLSEKPYFEQLAKSLKDSFPEPVTDEPRHVLVQKYRDKLKLIAFLSRGCDATIIRSPEGIGKTSVHIPIIADEALDEALDRYGDKVEWFFAVSFRSAAQAIEKAEEFRRDNYVTKIYRPFWEYYNGACAELGKVPIARSEFDDGSPSGVHNLVRERQPEVFRRLEQMRKALWSPDVPFLGGRTILLMTHSTVETFEDGVITRAWHHPEFDPFIDANHKELRERLRLSRVLVDDPEPDSFFYRLSSSDYDARNRLQEQYPNWKNLKQSTRVGVFQQNRVVPSDMFKSFETFDQYMRLDCSFDAVEVNFAELPYGQDQDRNGVGIYRSTHEQTYYLAAKTWLINGLARKELEALEADRPIQLTILTTEIVVADVSEAVFGKLRQQKMLVRQPFCVDLDRVDGIFPVKVPVYFDKRAAADQAKDRRISALAEEITTTNDNALVIADGVHDIPNVKTFQAMKGLNGLGDRDISVILTFLAPPKYAQLNVLGQWLDMPEIISNHYLDQINQAVGRNRGFRQSKTAETKTCIIASSGLWKCCLSSLAGSGRVLLYRSNDGMERTNITTNDASTTEIRASLLM